MLAPRPRSIAAPSPRVAAAFKPRADMPAFGVRHVRPVAAKTERSEILLYDAIGPRGISAADVSQALRECTSDRVVLRINSPGGDDFEALEITNLMRGSRATIECQVDGLAAGGATLIACAGSTLKMARESMLVLTQAAAVVVGDQRALTEAAALLTRADTVIAGILSDASGRPADAVARMMEAETWFTAAEAVDAGLADGLTSTPGKSAPAEQRAIALARPGESDPTCYSLETRRAQLRTVLQGGETLPPARRAVEAAGARIRHAAAVARQHSAAPPSAGQIATAARSRLESARARLAAESSPTAGRLAEAHRTRVIAAKARVAASW